MGKVASFVGKIFVVRPPTTKTTNILPHENYQLYGILAVPHEIYWLSSDLAAGLEGKGTTEPIYPMCARVSCVTTDLLHSLCIPFRVHITPFIGQLVSTTCGGCGMHQTHEKRFLPTTESV